MRHRLLLAVAATLLFVAPLLLESLRAQGGQGVVGGVAPPADQGPPAGRQGSDGRQGTQGDGRGGGGRGGGRAAVPAGPAPRNAAGRATLTGATPAAKGLWTPNFGITLPIAPVKEVPFQPWALALYNDRQVHELEPHTRCKASGVARQFLTPYGVEFVELTELQRIYIFDVGRTSHVPDHLHGRAHASREPDTRLLRPFSWMVGGRYARRRYRGVQRELLARPARAAPHRQTAHDRTLHSHRLEYDQVTKRPSMILARTPSRGPVTSIFAGRGERSSSNTCASKPTTRPSSWSDSSRRSTAPAQSSLNLPHA